MTFYNPTKFFRGTVLCLFSLLFFYSNFSYAVSLNEYPKLQLIAKELVLEKHYTHSELIQVFGAANIQQSVLDAMQNPAEYKFTWGKYRKLFLQEDRIQQGVEFWAKYQADLDRAEKVYGVPASVIVSIIGVESKFGKYRGKYKVLDSLVSLVVGYPRRSAFFAKELKHFLILSKQNNLDSHTVLGSYAGAVGYPQFISSSYRNYAVDFSGDGVVDIINNPVDAIGSIANYFIENGWKTGQVVTSKPHLTVNSELEALVNRKRKTQYTAGLLREKGADIPSSIPDDEKLGVLMLDASEIVPEEKQKNVYVVRAGDTACQIAEKHNVPCKTLFTLNKLNKKGAIYRGQRLKLPKNSSKIGIKVGVEVGEKKDANTKWVVEGGVADTLSTSKPRYFYTHHNFYAITEYNHSVLYAMAVHELSKAIAAAKMSTTTTTSGS